MSFSAITREPMARDGQRDGQSPELEPRHWFHGLIDRRTAEQRLVHSALTNSYLIRESNSSHAKTSTQKSYVLSFFGHKSGINHFRVQHICGHFYIGSKAFASLEALIRFYHSSDLLRGERLVSPVAAPEPLEDMYATATRMVAVLPYSRIPESDELSFKKGDLFVVHNDLQNGWLWCTNHRTLESGLVFGELLEQLDDSADENECYQWFHRSITKEEAVDQLARAGPGSFLVRPSDNSPGNYSLFFHISNSVQRFRIERRANRYVMGGRVFASLQEVVDRYRTEQIVEGFRLERPVLRAAADDQRWTAERAQQLSDRTDRTDVYQTLRESRELAKKSRSLRMAGYLHKKSQKHKKWKNYYFVVNAKECHLYYFENERRQRPKGVVDLSYAYVYGVHDSLFDRQNCFQVVERALPCISTVYYLSATDAETCRQWTQNIHLLCRPQHSLEANIARAGSPVTCEDALAPESQSVAASEPPVRQLRSLFVTLLEGNALPVKLCPNPYVEIQLNACVKVARTQVKCPPDPIWEEDYVLEDIPLDVTSFSFVLYNKGKRSKDTEIAETSVQLAKLRANEEFEDWFRLNGLCPPIRDTWGQVRARVRFQSELIMAFAEYSALKDLIVMPEDLEVVSVCEQFCQKDRQPLASAVLKIARFDRKECPMIRALIEREIRLENDVSTLFRANSLTTALIDQYMKSICQPFLRKCLFDSITKVLESKVSCELNPCRLDSPSEACHNAEHLLDILDAVVDHIFKTVADCPLPLRYICGCLQRAVVNKWPNDHLVRTRVVSGFVFLRLICPAILNPRNFSLINEIPSETASRTLILVAKSVQNLANLVEFGTKSIFITADRFEPPPPPNSKREPWMEIINPFIIKNKSKIIKFLDDLSQIQDSSCPPIPVTHIPATGQSAVNEEPSRELALIHAICQLHRQEVTEMAANRPTLKKLSAVIEMLTNHKNRFQELIDSQRAD